jgi:hypothetical protein
MNRHRSNTGARDRWGTTPRLMLTGCFRRGQVERDIFHQPIDSRRIQHCTTRFMDPQDTRPVCFAVLAIAGFGRRSEWCQPGWILSGAAVSLLGGSEPVVQAVRSIGWWRCRNQRSSTTRRANHSVASRWAANARLSQPARPIEGPALIRRGPKRRSRATR